MIFQCPIPVDSGGFWWIPAGMGGALYSTALTCWPCLFNWCLPSHIAHHISLIPQILKDGTEFFSRGSPNLVAVIPAMNHVDKDFTTKTQPNSRTHPAIQHALTLAEKTLNWYYSLTDESEVYWIVMVKPLLIFSMYYTDLTPLSQFFILNTSLNILSKLAGQPNGLKLQKHSWVKSSRKPTRTEHKMAMARMREDCTKVSKTNKLGYISLS